MQKLMIILSVVLAVFVGSVILDTVNDFKETLEIVQQEDEQR